MRKILFLFFQWIFYSIWAQNSFVISGYVYDETSLEPLVGAYVTNDDHAGTITNINGFYQLSVEKAKIELKANYAGYQFTERSFELSGDTIVNMFLPPTMLNEVLVSAEASSLSTNNTIQLPIRKIKSLPSLGGEIDVMKSLTLFPGISPGIEGFSGINVRGGSPDQNLILLDDAPVYNVSHLFGFVSVFNADAIKNIEVLKGGFPARYGGRLSSVINIAMKEGNKKEVEGEATVGLISSKLTLEVPLKKEKTSLMISGRSAYPDLITLPQKIMYNKGEKDMFINYSMWDANVKLHHQLNNNGNLSISHYSGRDAYSDKYREADFMKQESVRDWGNITNTIRYNQIFSNKLFVEAIAYHTKYSYENNKEIVRDLDGESQTIGIGSASSLQDISGKFVLGYTMNDTHELSGGLHYIFHKYRPSINNLSNSTIGSQDALYLSKDLNSIGHETAVFLEDEWEITRRLTSRVGLRHSSIDLGGQSFSGFEPRVAFNYSISPRFNLNAFYSYMRQYIHLLTSNVIGQSNDIWVPVTNLAPP